MVRKRWARIAAKERGVWVGQAAEWAARRGQVGGLAKHQVYCSPAPLAEQPPVSPAAAELSLLLPCVLEVSMPMSPVAALLLQHASASWVCTGFLLQPLPYLTQLVTVRVTSLGK